MVIIPTPSLRVRSREVDHDLLLSPKTQQLIRGLIPTVYEEDGVGLAAPQIGHNLRICVIAKNVIGFTLRPPKGEKSQLGKTDLVLVNPIWRRLSKKTTVDTEGCLSVPGFFGKVKRWKDLAVTAWNEKGEELKFEAYGFFARVIQHEVDHLDGILFIDRAKDLYKTEHKIGLEADVVLKNIRKIE